MTFSTFCYDQNKPNGQFYLPFNRQTILSFMRDLSIRKIPGIGRVNERLLESIGIKLCLGVSPSFALVDYSRQWSRHAATSSPTARQYRSWTSNLGYNFSCVRIWVFPAMWFSLDDVRKGRA